MTRRNNVIVRRACMKLSWKLPDLDYRLMRKIAFTAKRATSRIRRRTLFGSPRKAEADPTTPTCNKTTFSEACAGRELFLTQPGLGPADKRDPYEATNVESLAIR